jgi:ABC-type transporter Mla MlaB component
MTFSSKGTVAYLQGDLTHSGVTNKIINSLAIFLQQIVSIGGKNIRIDCRRILASDVSGLQLLYLWMECARFRGVEPELVNLPYSLQQAMQVNAEGAVTMDALLLNYTFAPILAQ